MRKATIEHTTHHSSVTITINLDGTGEHNIDTGIGYMDHMLSQMSKHGRIDLDVKAKGDYEVDDHHTVEDMGNVLGEAILKAIETNSGIERYGDSLIALDESLVQCALDLSNRPYLVWKVDFERDKVGNFDTELFKEFFYCTAMSSKMTLHFQQIEGINCHHISEACFKAFGRALKKACKKIS